MNSSVFYFTGTGNSLSVARKVASKIKGRLEPVSHYVGLQEVRIDTEVLGIVFPLYLAQFYGIPEIVVKFLRKLNLENVKYIFAICTYGGYGPVNAYPALENLSRLIKECGGRLHGSFSVRMTMNNLDYDHIPVPVQRNHDVIFKKAEKKVDHICERIMKKRDAQSVVFQKISNIVLGPMYYFLKMYILKSLYRLSKEPQGSNLDFHQLIPLTDRSIVHYPEKCRGCGICESICPVHNIKIIEGKPVWQHKCEMCFACDEFCSQGAIHHWGKIPGKNYHHPDITLEDMKYQSNSNYYPMTKNL